MTCRGAKVNQWRTLSVHCPVSSRVQQGLGPRLCLCNPGQHSPWHLVLPVFHQVPRASWSRRNQALWTVQSPTISGLSANFSANYGPLIVKIRNNMEILFTYPVNDVKDVFDRPRQWKNHVIYLKRKINIFFCKSIDTVWSGFSNLS